MPWKVDTFVCILYLRKGRLWKLKERPMIVQVVPGRTQDSKTQIFLFYSKCCVFFLLVSFWYLRGYLEWFTWNHHRCSGHYLIVRFQGRNIYVRDFAYVKIFSGLFILARTKPIYFAAIVTVYAFNKFHVLHAVDQMLLYADMPIKSLKTVIPLNKHYPERWGGESSFYP